MVDLDFVVFLLGVSLVVLECVCVWSICVGFDCFCEV